MLYRVVVRIWDPVWRTVFLLRVFSVHKVTYILLTPWCRVLLEKLTGLQLVKKFPAVHGTRRFITALTSVRHLSLLSSLFVCSAMFPLETLPPPRRPEWWSNLPPDCFVSRVSIRHVRIS